MNGAAKLLVWKGNIAKAGALIGVVVALLSQLPGIVIAYVR